MKGEEPRGNNNCDPGKNDVTVVLKNQGGGAATSFAVRVVVDGEESEAEEKALASLASNASLEVTFDDAGGLLSLETDVPDSYRRSATYVDKILKGAKPADLPMQQPTKFNFGVNLNTARAIGLAIPRPVLDQATDVIQ